MIIEQVLLNLLTNAVGYSSPNSLIQTFVQLKDNSCLIEIKDNGVELPPFDLNRLFEKFYRGTQTSKGGLGIGLSIVKGFIEAHNGQVFVEPNQPKGLVFTIIIPAELSYLNNLKNE